MKVIETISDSDIRKDFFSSPIIKRITERGEKKTLMLALNKGKKHPEHVIKKQSEIAKKRKKSIYKTLQTSKAKKCLSLLEEGISSVNEILNETKLHYSTFSKIRNYYYDGGYVKKTDNGLKGIPLTDEQREKIKLGLERKKFKCEYCDKQFISDSVYEKHKQKKHKKIVRLIKKEKNLKKHTYMSPEACRDWLWSMEFFRGYDDSKYITYKKNGGEFPKGFRTFPWVSEAKTNSRFFNKRLVEQDNNIEIVRKMYCEGFSLTIISEKLDMPKTTLIRLIKNNNITTEIPIGIRQQVTHRLRKTKIGRPIEEVDLNHLQKHIIKHKIKTTREFKKSGYDLSLETIKRRHPNFKWEYYKYNDKQKI